MQTFQGIGFIWTQTYGGDFEICIRAPVIESMILTIFAKICRVPSIPSLLPLHY